MQGYDESNGYGDYNSNYGSSNEYTGYNNENNNPNEYGDNNNGYYNPNGYQDYNSSYDDFNAYQDNNNSFSIQNESAEYYDTPNEPSESEEDGDYDTLTPEEIEYERRRKAAARRRKLAAREARRRKRRRQAIIRCSILLVVVILIIVGIIKMITGIWSHFHDDKKTKKTTEQMVDTTSEEATTETPAPEIDEAILAKELPADREAAIELLTQQAQTDSELQSILDNVAVYPDDVLRYLAVNSEMKQFASNYPAKISITFDGNFNVDFTAGTVPLFLQFDEQWGYADYSKDIVGLRGAAPTCLSMAYTYLKQDGSMNPIKVADFATEKGYLQEDGNTANTLMTEGAAELGLKSEGLTSNKDDVITALENGNVIICSVMSGDFSKEQHFILIREYKDGLFYVNDPSSEARSQVGWDYDRLDSQIANMWVISAQGTTSPDANADDDNHLDTDNTDTNHSDTNGTDTNNSNANTTDTNSPGNTNANQ